MLGFFPNNYFTQAKGERKQLASKANYRADPYIVRRSTNHQVHITRFCHEAMLRLVPVAEPLVADVHLDLYSRSARYHHTAEGTEQLLRSHDF